MTADNVDGPCLESSPRQEEKRKQKLVFGWQTEMMQKKRNGPCVVDQALYM